MTGIERLRHVAHGWDSKVISSIADQIEREHAEDCFRMGERLAADGARIEAERALCVEVGAPIDEGADPLDVLRRHVGCLSDTVENLRLELGEQSDAAAWVRAHGGLERVKQQRRESVPRAAYERKRRGWLDHIAECETALGKRREAIARLASENDALSLEHAQMRPRLLPPDKEWPKYKDWSPVNFDDTVTDPEGFELKVKSVEFHPNGFTLHGEFDQKHWYEDDDRFDYPAPKVLDADGAEIYEGRIAYGTRGRKYRVTALCEYEPSIVHAQALDDAEMGDEFIAANAELNSYQLDASKLTHERPEIDSWDRLERDANVPTCAYFEADTKDCEICGHVSWECSYDKARDLVRRAKALAGDA